MSQRNTVRLAELVPVCAPRLSTGSCAVAVPMPCCVLGCQGQGHEAIISPLYGEGSISHLGHEGLTACWGTQPPAPNPGTKQAVLVPWQDRDVREGTDMLMVKPGMPYLDLVRDVKARVRTLEGGLWVGQWARCAGRAQRGGAGLSPPLTRSRSTPRTRWPCTTSRGSSPCCGTARRPAPSAWRRPCRRQSRPSGVQVRLRPPCPPLYPPCPPGLAPPSRLSAGADIVITYFTPQLLRWLREAAGRP